MENDDLLQKYFHFDESDLFANRNGRLTTKQQIRLVGDERFFDKFRLVGGILLLWIAIGPAIVMMVIFTPCISNLCAAWDPFERFFLPFFVLFWTPPWIYWGIHVLRNALTTRTDYSLQTVEGPVNIVKTESTDAQTDQAVDEYELHIGMQEFDCDSEMANLMMQGDLYAVYYIEDTKEIMSAELLAKSK
jgi:hypothetical protein